MVCTQEIYHALISQAVRHIQKQGIQVVVDKEYCHSKGCICIVVADYGQN